MSQNDKIKFIRNLFNSNIHNLKSCTVMNEHKKKLFCLLVGERSVSVIINESFIDDTPKADIQKIFKDQYVYSSNENKEQGLRDINNYMVIWPNDTACQEQNSLL